MIMGHKVQKVHEPFEPMSQNTSLLIKETAEFKGSSLINSVLRQKRFKGSNIYTIDQLTRTKKVIKWKE